VAVVTVEPQAVLQAETVRLILEAAVAVVTVLLAVTAVQALSSSGTQFNRKEI
jgi:hypothetical protein